MKNLDNILKNRHYFANKGPSSQGYGFSCCHVSMWELDCEEAEPWKTDTFKQWKQCQTLFLGAPKSLHMVTAAMKLKDAYSLEEKLWPI